MRTHTITARRALARASLLAFAIVIGASPAPAAAAQSTEPPIDITVVEATVDPAQEAADQKVLDTAMQAFTEGGFPALTEHVDALKAMVAHAPRSYALIERRGSTVIVRALYGVNTLGITLVVSLQGGTTVVEGPNTYGTAFHILGSYANEVRNHADAIQWLDRGLALQPANWMLCLEKAVALGALRRHDEAVALIQMSLDRNMFLTDETRARLLRNKGIQLIDLKRLDEAEAALRESIRLLPNNPVAEHELRYIGQLRAGAPNSAPADIANQDEIQRMQEQDANTGNQ